MENEVSHGSHTDSTRFWKHIVKQWETSISAFAQGEEKTWEAI